MENISKTLLSCVCFNLGPNPGHSGLLMNAWSRASIYVLLHVQSSWGVGALFVHLTEIASCCMAARAIALLREGKFPDSSHQARGNW